MALSKEDAVAELVGQAVRLAQSLDEYAGANRVGALMAKHLLQMAVDSLAGQRALEFTLTPSQPISTPGSELRKVFEPWYLARYGEVYEWSAKEAAHAKRLMVRADSRGVGEVMRRAGIAAGQAWRTSPVTLGTLVSAWNALSVDDVDTRPTFKGGNRRNGI